MKYMAVREALTPSLRFPENKVVWALRLALVGLAVYALAVEPKYTTRPMLVGSAVVGLLATTPFAFVVTDRPRTLKAAEAAVLGAVMMHVGGHAFGLYETFGWYDTALHFSMPLVTALVLYALSQATDWIWDWRKVRPLEVGIYLFAMTITVGVLWEIMEFGMDRLAGTKEQENLVDTMVDLIMDTLGALLGAVLVGFATRHARRKGHHTVSEEPKAPTRGGGAPIGGAKSEKG